VYGVCLYSAFLLTFPLAARGATTFGIRRDGCRPARKGMGVGLYTILPLPILCGVWHKKGVSVGGRILRNGRAIVL